MFDFSKVYKFFAILAFQAFWFSKGLGLGEVHGLRLLEEFRNDLNEDDGFLILAPSEWLLAANN